MQFSEELGTLLYTSYFLPRASLDLFGGQINVFHVIKSVYLTTVIQDTIYLPLPLQYYLCARCNGKATVVLPLPVQHALPGIETLNAIVYSSLRPDNITTTF